MATNKLLCSFSIIGVFSIMLVCALSANAQFLRTSYFMEGTHYRQQLNPALTPTDATASLPTIKSQLLVWGATQMIHFGGTGTVTATVQPKSFSSLPQKLIQRQLL